MADQLDGVFIDGAWQVGRGPVLEDSSPADGSAIASIAQADEVQARAAMEAAQRAQHEWALKSSQERAVYLRDIADALEADSERMAGVISREMGKPSAQAAGEVGFAIEILRYTAEWARRIEGEIVPSDDPREQISLLRVPIGVIVAILPWNFPLALFVRKVAPALLTGNTVVLKPSEATPVVALEMMKLAEACDLPAGVLNVVVGEREIGEALVASPIAGLVTLTGSTRAGKAVMAAAAGNLTQVSLELGGKAPAIVWTDADLDLAVDSILQARHMNTGQVCTCAERVFVHESRFDDFVSAYSKGVEGLTMGDPAGEFDLGPLVSETQRDKVVASTEQALASGATAVVEGGIPTDGDFQNGSWIKPTVLVDVDPEMKVMTDETFGPVTPIVPVSSLDQVVDFANESRAALASYVFSFDTRVIRHFTRRMDAGEVYVNRSIGEALQAFHSGHKESGIGGEDGRHGVLKYTNIRSVYERFPD